MGEKDFDWDWFINNIWQRENAEGLAAKSGKGGYSDGRYHPYQATNGIDIGPGFDLAHQSAEFRRKAYSTGFTKKELDDSLRNQFSSELKSIDEKIRKLGGDPSRVTNDVKAGLLDIYHQRNNGLYSEFPKLWNAVINNDYEGMQQESRTVYKDKKGNVHPDNSRWEFRKNTYFKTPKNVVTNHAVPPYNIAQPLDALAVKKPVIVTPLQVQKKADGGSLDDNYWDYLPLKEKAEMMRVAINNGITTLPEIRDAYNKFAKGGKMNGWTMEDEAGYRYWRSRLPKNLRDTDGKMYDMRGAYKAGMQPMWSEEDKSYHLQSRDPKSGRIFKSPLHSTYLKALMEDASMGYYPTVDNKGNTYTKTWPGNTLYEKEEPEVPFKAYGGNLFGDGGDTRQPSNSERAMSYLMSRGMSNTGAAAIVGTLQAESGLNPAIHAKMKGDDGEGLAQWTGSRKKNFWKTLETIEPGAQKKYGSIVNVPLERQLDVILAERPTVTAAIHNAKDINTATDIMLRGYENGGGAAHNLATVNQMNNIYGKWNNGYDNQMKVRLGNANKLLGLEIDPSTYQISQGFFDDINAQISNLPEVQLPDEMATDPTLRYNVPTIDETLLRQPKEGATPVEQVYDPRQERLERLQNFNTIMGMMGAETPLTGLVGSGSSGLFDAINKIYS